MQFSTSRALLENMPVVDVLTTNSLCVCLTSDVNIEVLARGTAGFSGRTELHVHVGSSLFEEGKRIVFWAGMSVNSRTHPVTNLLICSYAVRIFYLQKPCQSDFNITACCWSFYQGFTAACIWRRFTAKTYQVKHKLKFPDHSQFYMYNCKQF